MIRWRFRPLYFLLHYFPAPPFRMILERHEPLIEILAFYSEP